MEELPTLPAGRNTFSDQNDTRWLIRSLYDDFPEADWLASKNYWGTTDIQNILARISNQPLIEPIETQAHPCGHYQNECNLEGEIALFRSAWEQEREAQFETAITSYKQLIDEYPKGKFAKDALDRISFCKKALSLSWQEIRSYFLDIAADSTKDSSLVILCKSNAAWCLVEMDQYDQAYAELDSLLNHTDKEYLRLTISLKQLLAELREDEYGFMSIRKGGREINQSIDEAEEIFSEKFDRINLRVDSLLSFYKGKGESSPPNEPNLIPTKYSLYQNYPNPFNPNTEIKFDLPENIHVELAIYNTLGQKVTTLINEERAAGAYRIIWDSKNAGGMNVASGVYIYQIKAGNFIQSRKMILIR